MRAGRKRGAGGVLLLVMLTGVIAMIASCYGATQVTLEISRDVKCAPPGESRTGIFVGRPGHGAIDPVLETEDCTDLADGSGSRIGSLVIVPTDERDARVTVEVAIALKPLNAAPEIRPKNPKECLLDATDCIVARRSFTFIEHESRLLPIRLFDDCRDLTCLPGTTCIARDCRPDDIEAAGFCPDPRECQLQPGVDSGLDAKIDATVIDATTVPDATLDVSVVDGGSCQGVLVSGESEPAYPRIVANDTTLYWVSKDGNVESIRKDGTGGKKRVHTTQNGGTGAIAIDDTGDTLWLADKATIFYVRNLKDGGTSTSTNTSPTTAVSMSAPGAKVYFTNGTGGTFYMNASSPTAAFTMSPVLTAKRLSAFVEPGGGDIVYAVHQSFVVRHYGDASTTLQIDGGRDVLGGDGGAFVSTTDQILRVGAFASYDGGGDAGQLPVVASPTKEADNLARSGSVLFWTQGTTGVGVLIVRRDLTSQPAVTTSLPLGPYTSIVGLVVDANCVYYWAPGGIYAARNK